MNATTICVTLTLLLTLSHDLSCEVDKGSISGSVGYFSETQFEGDVKNAVVVVALKRSEFRFRTNENGDFGVELSPGTWSLVRVLDGEGKELRIHEGQSRSFSVKRDKNTRFDIMIRPTK